MNQTVARTTTRLHVLLFTDLVDSSRLKIDLGDADYVSKIARPHNLIFRNILGRFPGAEENNYTGDGFLATFRSVHDAVNFALLFHRALKISQWHAVTPSTRIGIHIGDTVEFDAAEDAKLLASHAADMCARVMSLGDGGQTLLTRAAFDSARQYVRQHPETGEAQLPAIQWLAHGRYFFKGKDDPMEVFEVGAVGSAPLRAPDDSEKARRALSVEEEQTLGWRPGARLEIPGKPGWILQKKLGEGGFGEVWLAKHGRLKEDRVFKFCFDSDRLRSFKRELTFFRLIQEGLGDRDDIASLLDVRVDSPPFFLESEFVRRGNLRQWFENSGGIDGIPLGLRLRLLADIARAVAAAHSLGIIHKDIKPSNVFIEERADGTLQPKLADFGIGVLTDLNLLSAHDVTDSGFTESIALANDSSRTGTRLYSPPESQVGKPASTAGDVYALGIMLYQLVVADLSRPLGVGWEADIVDELLREDITACTHRDAQQRLKTAAELADRIEQLELRRQERQQEARVAAELMEAEQRAAEQAKKTKLLTIVLAVTVLFTAMAGLAAIWINLERQEAVTQRAEAEKQRLLAEKQKKIVEQQKAIAVSQFNEAERQRTIAQTQERLAKESEDIAEENRMRAVEAQMKAVLAQQLEAMERRKAEQAEQNADARRVEAELVLSFFQEHVLAAARPEGQDGGLGIDATIRDAIEAAEPLVDEQFADRPLVEASIRSTLGLTYQYLGEPYLAIPHLEHSRKTYSSLLEANHADVLQSNIFLASAYRDVGRLRDALALFESTLALLRAKYGPQHEDTLLLIDNLALTYRYAGEFKKALEMFEETLTLVRDKKGPKHPDTLGLLAHLGLTQLNAGQLEEAESVLQEALKLRQQQLGIDHPDTITSMNNLAMLHLARGRIATAKSLLNRTLELSKAKFGPKHPHTLRTMNNLANISLEEGRYEQALSTLHTVVDEFESRIGPDHPHTLQAQSNLGAAYRLAGRALEALALLKRTRKQLFERLGSMHPASLTANNNLAAVLLETNQLEAAVDLYEETLTLMKQKLGTSHSKTLTAMNNLATAYERAGRRMESLQLIEESFELTKTALGPIHPLTLRQMVNLGAANRIGGRVDKAITLLQNAERIGKSELPPDHPTRLSSMSQLAIAYRDTGRVNDSLPLFAEVVKHREASRGPSHKLTLVAIENLADAYHLAARPGDAIPLYEELLELRKSMLGPSHDDTLNTMNRLAAVYLHANQAKMSLATYRDYVDRRRELHDPEDLRTCVLLVEVARPLLQYHQYAEAEAYLRDCLRLCEKVAPDHWYLYMTKSLIGAALVGQQKYDETETLLLQGYNGLQERRATIPAKDKNQLVEAVARLVKFYSLKKNTADLEKWQQRLKQLQEQPKKMTRSTASDSSREIIHVRAMAPYWSSSYKNTSLAALTTCRPSGVNVADIT